MVFPSLSIMVASSQDANWALARQVGLDQAITSLEVIHTSQRPTWSYDVIQRIASVFAKAGFTLHGLEGDQFDMERINLGQKGRDEDIDHYCETLHAMSRAGLRMICYSFMAGLRAVRTTVSRRGRADAPVAAYDHAIADRELMRWMPSPLEPDGIAYAVTVLWN